MHRRLMIDMQALTPSPTDSSHITQYTPGNTFTKAFDWIDRLEMPPNHKRVFDFIIRVCGYQGQNSCGHEFIAEHLNISEKTVTRAVANIEARRFVTVHRGYQQPNHYTIHPLILKVAWTELDRAQALAEIRSLAKKDKMSVMLDRHEHETCRDLSSARVGAAEDMLSAARGSEANGTVAERKALVGEIIGIRNELHRTDPNRYPEIVSPRAYTGKLASKSTQELKTELEQNRKVLENSKKPKSAPVPRPGRSLAAQVAERERESFTGCGEAWFTAWAGLDEKEQIKWREQTEARLWNDLGWAEWCRRNPDPVEQELGRRRATRNLFREEWETLHGQPVAVDPAPAGSAAGDVADVANFGQIVAGPQAAAATSLDTAPAGSTNAESVSRPDAPAVANPDHQPEMVTATGNQVTPTTGDPDADPPPSAPNPKARIHRTRRPARRQPTQPPRTATATTTSAEHQADQSAMENGCSIVAATGNVLAFRRPIPLGPFPFESLPLSVSADKQPGRTRGQPDDG